MSTMAATMRDSPATTRGTSSLHAEPVDPPVVLDHAEVGRSSARRAGHGSRTQSRPEHAPRRRRGHDRHHASGCSNEKRPSLEDAAGEQVGLHGARARIVRHEEHAARLRRQCITIVAPRHAAIRPLALVHGRAQQQQRRAEREQRRPAAAPCPPPLAPNGRRSVRGDDAVHRDEARRRGAPAAPARPNRSVAHRTSESGAMSTSALRVGERACRRTPRCSTRRQQRASASASITRVHGMTARGRFATASPQRRRTRRARRARWSRTRACAERGDEPRRPVDGEDAA